MTTKVLTDEVKALVEAATAVLAVIDSGQEPYNSAEDLRTALEAVEKGGAVVEWKEMSGVRFPMPVFGARLGNTTLGVQVRDEDADGANRWRWWVLRDGEQHGGPDADAYAPTLEAAKAAAEAAAGIAR